jgi:hypothetical protein
MAGFQESGEEENGLNCEPAMSEMVRSFYMNERRITSTLAGQVIATS